MFAKSASQTGTSDHNNQKGSPMKRYFKDFYGGTASIAETSSGFRLCVADGHGRRMISKLYKTYRGARCAMGKLSDSWKEVCNA